MASTTNINNSKCMIGVQNNQNTTVHNYNDNNQLETKYSLPRLIKNFYGRKEEFEKLDSLFFNEKKLAVVIYGLPGYGKTEISKQYAKYCQDNERVDKVFWVEMEDIDKLKDISKDLNQIYKEYKAVRCMFVLDNSLNRQSIFHCEPVGNQNHLLLITSHEADWGPGITALPLGTLAPPAAVDIIRTILNGYYKEEDRASYEALAEAVYCVPLGVQVAAAYVYKEIKCLKHRFNFTEYIKDIEQSQDFIAKKIPGNISNPYEKSIYGALTISLNKIKHQNDNESELALNILYFCAFFRPEHIKNKDLLRIGTISALIVNNENKLRLAIELLTNFSFVKYGGRDDDYIQIHRLTQLCVRIYLREHDLLDECYRECLHAVFNVDSIYYEHDNSILCYADDNISVVYQFVKNNKDKIEEILVKLVLAGCSECLKTILEYQDGEQDFEISPEIKNELLIFAAKDGKLKVIQVLIDYKADVNYQNYNKVTPSFLFIRYVCRYKPNISKEELNDTLKSLNYKQHVQVIDEETGHSSLHDAAGAVNEYLITLLTKEDVAEIINKQDRYIKFTPLHWLILGSDADSNKEEIVRIVRKLKACGAKLNIKNRKNETPLEMLLKQSEEGGYECDYFIEHLMTIEDLDLEESFLWELFSGAFTTN